MVKDHIERERERGTEHVLGCGILRLRAFGSVCMSGHLSVASPTEFSVPRGTWWHTLAPHTARATRPVAQIWP